jgi:hypothetical protein
MYVVYLIYNQQYTKIINSIVTSSKFYFRMHLAIISLKLTDIDNKFKFKH